MGIDKSLNQSPQGGLEKIGYTSSNGSSGNCCKIRDKYLIGHVLGGQNGGSTLEYLSTFHFVLRHFTIDTFMFFILPKLDHYILLSHTSHHYTWPHTPLLIKRRCKSVFDFLGCAFIHLLNFRFNIFHDDKAWQIVDLLVMILSFWQLACWVLICLLLAFWALVIIVFIHQLVLFCQHGITIHGPVWHYLFEVRHFHYMMDEHISEYSSFEAFCISVCSSLHAGAYPFLWDYRTFRRLHSPFDLVINPRDLHTRAYPSYLSSSDLQQTSLTF